MTTSKDVPLHLIPIPSRPPPTLSDTLRTFTFNSTFLLYLLFAHTFQLLFLPFLGLSILSSFSTSQPFRSIKEGSREVFRLGIKWTKEIFASVLVFIVVVFGKSRLVVSCDTKEELEELVERDREGKVIGFKIQKHAVWMSNHQCYVDWIMIWLVLAFGKVSEGIVIIIKASLQWAPLVGPAMQLFRFVFLSRSKPLSQSTMYETARDSVERDDPFQLLIYPEGTLYSSLTRPKSKAFADAQGIPDMEYTLLPRSTGLLYTLRLLSTLFPSSPTPTSPSLTLYDLTIGYSGVAPQTYAQSHYTLQSIFGRGIPPPKVHMHVQSLRIKDIPIGQVRQSARPKHIENEITSEERKVFEEWIFARWREKDERMGGFDPNGGGFRDVGEGRTAEFDVRLRKKDWIYLGSVPVGLTVFWFVASWAVRMGLNVWRS